jgi:predicted enzyme related to lactoylglutathione lyase
VPNQICQFEIDCRDRAKAAEFCSKMFEWNNTAFGWFADPEGNMIGVYAEQKK